MPIQRLFTSGGPDINGHPVFRAARDGRLAGHRLARQSPSPDSGNGRGPCARAGRNDEGQQRRRTAHGSRQPLFGPILPSDALPTSPSYCLNVDPAATPCSSAADIANAQLTEWLTRVRAELPSAYVKICVDSAPFDANGTPRFNCTSTGAGATTVIKIGWSRLSTDRSATGANATEQGTVPSLVLPVTPGNST